MNSYIAETNWNARNAWYIFRKFPGYFLCISDGATVAFIILNIDAKRPFYYSVFQTIKISRSEHSFPFCQMALHISERLNPQCLEISTNIWWSDQMIRQGTTLFFVRYTFVAGKLAVKWFLAGRTGTNLGTVCMLFVLGGERSKGDTFHE